MTTPSALFVTARQKSLGETYTAARFAADLTANGWNVRFAAFPFAADFLRQGGWKVAPLSDDRTANQRALNLAAREISPSLIITSDYYLNESADVAHVWSNNWLFDLSCPVATFDHLMLHPRLRRITIECLRRFEAPKAGDPGAPKGPRPRTKICEIQPLPDRIAAIVRPCPLHDPRIDPDDRIFKFNLSGGAGSPGERTDQVRCRLGLPVHERLVLVPVGSWAIQLCTTLGIPYMRYYPRLLARYFSACLVPVRLVFVSGELEDRVETSGQVTLQYRSGLPVSVVDDLVRTSDLVIADNVTSATVTRAVIAGVPAAAFVNSVSARPAADGVAFDSPFPLSAHVEGLVRSIEREAPGSIFPSAVFPLGWLEELRPLFDGNRYARTFERLELFDEGATTCALQRLLCDESVRRELREHQAAYCAELTRLPGAAAISERILARAQEVMS
ncbi:MAG TPA: DUF6365 family protein [Vicinamibacterales bacterium]